MRHAMCMNWVMPGATDAVRQHAPLLLFSGTEDRRAAPARAPFHCREGRLQPQ